MYLISLYFDDKSCAIIQKLIDKVSLASGNRFMIDGKVPPHITIASFQTDNEEVVIEELDKSFRNFRQGKITWASIGTFKSSVIFLAPVLNEYMHNLSVHIYEVISLIHNISISKYYLPFSWMPHTTIAKKLSDKELMVAFQKLNDEFSIFNGSVVKIALSKTNPYEDIKVWELKK